MWWQHSNSTNSTIHENAQQWRIHAAKCFNAYGLKPFTILTRLTMCTSVSLFTSTTVSIHSVMTAPSMLARMAQALIDVFKVNVTLLCLQY